MVSEKTKFVLDGHKTADPVGSTYAGTVSRESARIALTYTALNNHDIFAAENEMLSATIFHKGLHYMITLNLVWKMSEMLYSSTGSYMEQDCWM